MRALNFSGPDLVSIVSFKNYVSKLSTIYFQRPFGTLVLNILRVLGPRAHLILTPVPPKNTLNHSTWRLLNKILLHTAQYTGQFEESEPAYLSMLPSFKCQNKEIGQKVQAARSPFYLSL